MKADIDADIEAMTERIIDAAFVVSRSLGHGFLEAVYKNALLLEIAAQGLEVVKERPFPIFYRDEQIGIYVADLVVNGAVIVELKAAENLSTAHTAQVLNYLKASHLTVGLLINFGKPRIEFKRILRKL